MRATPAPGVEATALTKRFAAVTAVDGLDLRIDGGTIFGLLGSNGAGKTTLIRMLVTLLPVTSGSARVAGCDLLRSPRLVRRAIGYVPQSLSADGGLTGRENLWLAARLHALDAATARAAIAEALAFMELGDAADRLVRTYSGGMIRRLEIAQAMLHRPAVLFLDEPTVGLDPVARHVVWERIARLRERFGTTVILTTHDMDEADRLCERVMILSRGRAVLQGSPSELKSRIGPAATMDDVFISATGGRAHEAHEGFSSAQDARRAAGRLG